MKFSTTVLLMAVGLMMAFALTGARPRGGRGGGRPGRGPGNNGDNRPPRGPRVRACSLQAEGAEIDSATCPEEYPDCDQGPLEVTVDGQQQSISFCNTPVVPKKEDVCRVTNADGSEFVPEGPRAPLPLKTCPEGTPCELGPFTHGDKLLYTCGTGPAPETPDYAEILLSKACEIDGNETEKECKHGGTCDGLEVTVNGQQAKFCAKPENDDEEEEGDDEEEENDEDVKTVLDLFNGRCRGRDGGNRGGRGGDRGGRRGDRGGRGGDRGGRGGDRGGRGGDRGGRGGDRGGDRGGRGGRGGPRS